jgi:hypothetical protein
MITASGRAARAFFLKHLVLIVRDEHAHRAQHHAQ